MLTIEDIIFVSVVEPIFSVFVIATVGSTVLVVTSIVVCIIFVFVVVMVVVLVADVVK